MTLSDEEEGVTPFSIPQSRLGTVPASIPLSEYWPPIPNGAAIERAYQDGYDDGCLDGREAAEDHGFKLGTETTWAEADIIIGNLYTRIAVLERLNKALGAEVDILEGSGSWQEGFDEGWVAGFDQGSER